MRRAALVLLLAATGAAAQPKPAVETLRGEQPIPQPNASEPFRMERRDRVIPRNHKVEEALTAAVEHGDLSVMHRLLEVLADPHASTAPPA